MSIGRVSLCALTFLLAARCFGAEVVVIDGAGNPAPDVEVTIVGSDGQTVAVTDDNGRVAVPEKREDRLAIVARANNGHCGALVAGLRSYPPAELPDSQEIYLGPPRRLRIAVKTDEGEPAAKALVTVVSNYCSVARVETDDSGGVEVLLPTDVPLQYLLAEHPAGTDYVLVRREGEPVSDPYRLSPEHEGDVTLTLAKTRPVKLRIVDSSGAPVEGATAAPWLLRLPNHGDSLNLGARWLTTTNDEGLASFTQIPAGLERPITIWVRKEGYKAIRVEYDPASDPSELTASLPSLVTVTGRVLGPDGEPRSNAYVMASGSGYGMDDYRGSVPSESIASDGTFSIEVDPNQFYAFGASATGFASPVETLAIRTESPAPIELRLQPATVVSGRVVDSVSGKPVAKQYVSLYRHAGMDTYSKLPEDERLPNPDGSRRHINAYLTYVTISDEEGRFTIETGPGEHYFHTNRSVGDTARFSIEPGQSTYEATLTIKPEVVGKLKGLVLAAGGAEEALAGVQVEDSFNYFTGAVTGDEGGFELPLSDAPRTIGAFTADRKLGAITDAEALAESVTLKLAPTASASGTLTNSEGADCSGEEVVVYVQVENPDGTFCHRFQRSATADEAGAFSVDGLAVGVEYKVAAITERDGAGNPQRWSPATTFRPEKPGPHDLGTVSYRVYREPTIDDYLPRVFAKDPAKRLEQRLADAKLAYQQVLLVVGEQESDAVRRLIGASYYTGPWVAENELRHAMAPYLMVGVAPDQKDLLGELNVSAPSQPDGFTLAVVDVDGRVVAAVDSTEVSKNERLSSARVTEFLKTRATPLPDAEEAYAHALAEAERDDKRVIAIVSGAGCGPCVLLSRFLDKHAGVVGSDYVVLKLDDRMPHGSEVIDRVRGDADGGIPWTAILSAEGERLADSTGPNGNIGFPSSETGVAHFRTMLEATRNRLTDAELDSLISELSD